MRKEKGLVQDLLRHIEPVSIRRTGQDERNHGAGKTHPEQEQNSGGGAPFHKRFILRPVMLGHNDAASGGKAHGNGQKQEAEACGRSDRRKGVLPIEFSDDDRVRRVI